MSRKIIRNSLLEEIVAAKILKEKFSKKVQANVLITDITQFQREPDVLLTYVDDNSKKIISYHFALTHASFCTSHGDGSPKSYIDDKKESLLSYALEINFTTLNNLWRFINSNKKFSKARSEFLKANSKLLGVQNSQELTELLYNLEKEYNKLENDGYKIVQIPGCIFFSNGKSKNGKKNRTIANINEYLENTTLEITVLYLDARRYCSPVLSTVYVPNEKMYELLNTAEIVKT